MPPWLWLLLRCALILLMVVSPLPQAAAVADADQRWQPPASEDEFSGLGDILKSKGPQALTDMLKKMTSLKSENEVSVKKDADGNEMYDFTNLGGTKAPAATTAALVTPSPVAVTTGLPASPGQGASSGTSAQSTSGSPLSEAMDMLKANGISDLPALATTASPITEAMKMLKGSSISDVPAQAMQATQVVPTLPAAQAMKAKAISVNVSPAPTVLTQPLEGGPMHAQVAMAPQIPVASAPPQPLVMSPLAAPLPVGVAPYSPIGTPGSVATASASNAQLAAMMNGLEQMQRNMAAMMGATGASPYAQPQGGPTTPVDPAFLAPSQPIAQTSASQDADLANLVARMERMEKQEASLNSALEKEQRERVRFKTELMRKNKHERGDKSQDQKAQLRLSRRLEELENRMKGLARQAKESRMKRVAQQAKASQLPVARQEGSSGIQAFGERATGLGLMRTFFHTKNAAAGR